jgi:hypothetical protein
MKMQPAIWQKGLPPGAPAVLEKINTGPEVISKGEKFCPFFKNK